jgi:hypothetical protein
MARRFNFENALGWPFTAPHVGSFPWIFGLAYAAVYVLVLGAIGFAAWGDVAEWMARVSDLDDGANPDEAFAALFTGLIPLIPWITLLTLASWVIWAMFEAASQRRYIWGKSFSLGFGGDELRMMVLGFFWWVLSMVLIAAPMLLMFGAMFGSVFANIDNPEVFNTPEYEQQIVGQIFGIFGLLMVFFPVYVFFATRLAPSFGLTIKDKRIRFFDAWGVSRGRFWPILGAYVILAIGAGIINQVISTIAQLIFMPAMSSFTDIAEQGGDPVAIFASPGFLISMGVFYFITLFLQGVTQHIVGGPAAFAARHDPKGGVEETEQLDVFS